MVQSVRSEEVVTQRTAIDIMVEFFCNIRFVYRQVQVVATTTIFVQSVVLQFQLGIVVQSQESTHTNGFVD